ncbi:hypothetical protein JCM6882_005732 [Rhodosporidiobolus microsporus]
MSSYKRSSRYDDDAPSDARSPPRSSRRGRDDDDGDLPWWEQDRRGGGGGVGGGSSRGFDDDDRSSRRGGGGYYDRDRMQESGGLPYDEPPRGTGGGGGAYGRSRYDDRDRDYRGGSRGGYGDNRRGGRGGYGGGGGRGGHDGGRRDGYGHEQRDRRGSFGRDDRHRSRSIEPSQAQRSAAPPVFSSAAAGSDSAKPAPVAEGTGAEEGEIAPPAEAPMDLSSLDASEPDPEAILAERRRKRAEILAKYASASASPAVDAGAAVATPPAVKREIEGAEEAAGTPGRQEVERAAKRLRIGTDSPAVTSTAVSTAEPSRATSADPTPAPGDEAFSLEKDSKEAAAEQEAHPTTGADGEVEVSAADYNPDGADDDRDKREKRVREQGGDGVQAEEMVVDDEGEEEEMEEEEEEDDDEDDMFAIGTETKPKAKKMVKKRKAGVPIVSRPALDSKNASLLADNYDDPEGYYKVILGEAMDNGRYHVVANLGKGMFSSVVKARDLGVDGKGAYEDEDAAAGLKGKRVGEAQRREVAIKLVRSQESMFKAGLKEAQILRRLRDADPDDKKHLVRLLRTFEHRGHLCLVFESLSMNLREVVKRYGKDVGLNLRAVRAYASQMFLALALMRKCEIMHADLKPDNILVNESKSTLKVCDLGSASDVSETEITPYLVSRFYRAPEIILGNSYDCSLDVWSIACTLYELFTGKILFPGRTNNHMLLLIMETKGKFNHKLIRKARFHDQHFDENMNFLYVEKNDSITPRAIASKPPSDLRSRLMPPGLTRTMKDDDVRMLANFVDLLDKMLSLEPARRPTPKELLNHPFIRG